MKENKIKRYVIQEHDATNLHWDLRLEMDGVLKSWAVPKTPSALKKKGVKRLAIQVSDHDLDYGDFEGEIKEGYGKGTVKIWDSGSYELLEKDKKKVEFKINGKKLSGKYVLIKTNYGNSPEQKEKNWLFFKVE
jgi:DNA ligase D-like protein (predicted 3'-phosphoesterase)